MLFCGCFTLQNHTKMYHELSFWEKNTFLSHIDAIIIGSGIVGLNAAISLKEKCPQWRVVVLERGVLPYGASTRNAGFACFGSISELLDDLQSRSTDEVLALVEKRWKGLQKLRSRLGDEKMGFEPWGGCEIFTAKEKALFESCAEKVDFFNQNLAEIIGEKEIYRFSPEKIAQNGFANVEYLIENVAEGQIDTGKMMHNLLLLAREKGVEIMTGIGVSRIEEAENEAIVLCENGWQMATKQVIVCTNGFARKLLPDLAVNPARNQVWITAPIENLRLKGTFHYEMGYFYFRNVGQRILLGGGRHLDKINENTVEFGQSEIIQHALNELLTNVIYPHQSVAIEMKWSGILGIGEEKKPIIEQISPHLHVAVRMGGMGVAIGSLVGEEVASLVADKYNI